LADACEIGESTPTVNAVDVSIIPNFLNLPKISLLENYLPFIIIYISKFGNDIYRILPLKRK